MAMKTLKISLRLWGESLNPSIVTNSLGMQPTQAYEKGYVKNLASGKVTAPRELGIWVVEHVISGSIEENLDIFLKRFEGKSLKSIEGVQILVVDLYLGLSAEDGSYQSFEYRVTQDALRRLADLGADLRVTIA